MLVLAAASTLLAATGCANRITVTELTEREQQLAATVPVPVEHSELALTDMRPYRVRVGDVLGIRMVGLSEDRYAPVVLQARVHEDGAISLPVVGPVQVEGLTLGQAEQAVIAAHVPNVVKDMAVFVELIGPESTTVVVLGAVQKPGLTKLPQNERNLLYALAAAGGFQSNGSGRVRLKPIRPERDEFVYDLNDVNDVRRALLGPPLEAGDVLTAEFADNSAVYVSGLLNRPGPILVPPGTTISVLRAIAAAGGLREYLQIKEGLLVRQLPDGKQVHVKLNIGDMLANRTADLALRPGDILEIPHTADTLFQEWFLKNVLAGPFNVGLRYDPLAQYNAERALRDRYREDSLQQAIRSSLGSSIPGLLIPPVVPPATGRQ